MSSGSNCANGKSSKCDSGWRFLSVQSKRCRNCQPNIAQDSRSCMGPEHRCRRYWRFQTESRRDVSRPRHRQVRRANPSGRHCPEIYTETRPAPIQPTASSTASGAFPSIGRHVRRSLSVTINMPKIKRLSIKSGAYPTARHIENGPGHVFRLVRKKP